MKKALFILRVALCVVCTFSFIYVLSSYMIMTDSSRQIYLLLAALIFILYYEAAFFFECIADGVKRVIKTSDSRIKAACLYLAFFAIGYMFVSFSVSRTIPDFLKYVCSGTVGLCLLFGQEITIRVAKYGYELKQKA